jgi:para-aminobenzoate synthetase component 1
VRTLIESVETRHSPCSLAAAVRSCGGLVLLESTQRVTGRGRISLVTVAPRVTFRSSGAKCEFVRREGIQVHYGNPWRVLESWLAVRESPVEEALPFPAGGLFGYWGYELRQFVEPKLRPHAIPDGLVPDCWLGFYDSLVVFDHLAGKTWVVSTGQEPDGGRSSRRARERLAFWMRALRTEPRLDACDGPRRTGRLGAATTWETSRTALGTGANEECSGWRRAHQHYEDRVRRAQAYIRQGEIYQVNLARRWWIAGGRDGWGLYRELATRSPAPYAAYLEAAEFAIVSASPELFLRLDGPRILTRPIKGTRPRGRESGRDAALAAELWRSPKERAELTMITDLLRNDLGKVCEYGSIRVPELMRLERFAQVQHLVSTVEGRLRGDVSQVRAIESCFPGGSVTGAPKFRAMQLIDHLEPVGRGPYTGCLGYLGFNRRSQLSILIRAAVCTSEATWFHGGAGIVADSEPVAEGLEVLAKVQSLREILDMAGDGRAHLPGLGLVPAWSAGV